MKSGVLCFYKPAGMTSHDAVNIIRRLYGTRSVGHTGTLDPDACGVLVVMVGRAVKAAEFLGSAEKEYTALMRLGLRTDTQDTGGRVTYTHKGAFPPENEVMRVCASFKGEGTQIPPMYSAIKIGGKKLVDLARKNIDIERAPRPVYIYSLDVQRQSEGDYLLHARVSAGTYIRTLCADIGDALGCGGAMAYLERTSCGGVFTKENSHTRDELEALDTAAREELLMPVEELFSDWASVKLPPFFEKLARCGAEIYLKKTGVRLAIGERVRLYGEDGFFAVGEVREFPDGCAIKPLKQLVLRGTGGEE